MSGSHARLTREVALPGAVLLGLGSMVGTGVFVSIGLAADVAGTWLLPAILLAGALAACNGLSSAQLAAAHPVSGGTYEYGYRLLGPAAGFSAGWLFLLAKGASAATAALGLSGYTLRLAGVDAGLPRTLLAVAAVIAVTALAAGGMRRSTRGNAVVVGATLAAFALFLALGLPSAVAAERPVLPRAGFDAAGLLHGAALMFVAFTGYGRIATLGEEVRDPARTIPRAVGLTVVLVLLLYAGVGAVGLGVLGPAAFGAAARGSAAPLEVAAEALGWAPLPVIMAIAAVSAMGGVLLNLVLGLSRVALAMGRRGDLPAGVARLSPAGPARAVWLVGIGVAALTLTGDVGTTWSFSAFTVLVYYALTNLAALRLPAPRRRFPRWVAMVGLVGCLGLAFRVEPAIWLTGAGLLGAGLLWHLWRRRSARPPAEGR